jgi:hypothetical protein
MMPQDCVLENESAILCLAAFPPFEHVKWNIGESDLNTAGENHLNTGMKSRITIKGGNVFEGMKAMVDAGYLCIDGDVPDHIRDATQLDSVINVVNDVVVNRRHNA